VTPNRVTKAVLPVAGLATRLLPATKANPKVMLPVVDKPAIQYVVEEAASAGLDDILIITGRGKNAIEDHFDRAVELEVELEARGKHELLKQVRELTNMATIHYVRQAEPRGLGHAVSIARKHVGKEAFAVMLPDDIVQAPVLQEMLDAHARTGKCVIALMEMAPEEISAYGSVAFERIDDRLVRVSGVVEKPAPGEAPSNFAIIGRYVLTAEIFDALERVTPGKGGEIQLTDAIGLVADAGGVVGYTFSEGRYDVGNRFDYLRATVELALQTDDLGPPFRAFLREVVDRDRNDS
jgi:UTP--glucose-1-phosphate uridylyltransferase